LENNKEKQSRNCWIFKVKTWREVICKRMAWKRNRKRWQSLCYFVLVFTFFLYTLLYPIYLQEKICLQA